MTKLCIVILAISLNYETKVPIIPLLRMIDVESGYDPKKVGVNPNGTRDYGVMQLNSKYLAYYAEKFNDGAKFDPMNATDNIRIGLRYLRWLYEQVGSWEGAFAAFNCGLTRLRTGDIPWSTVLYICKIF